jgi:DNA-binding MarR family transcriptional regulator
MTSQQILVALRRIMRAIDLRSKHLEKLVGLTVPQLLVLQQLQAGHELSVSEIARGVNLSQSTVTSMLHRLEAKGLVTRKRNEDDRRKVRICLTREGREQVRDAPGLLQEEFVNRFEMLEPWEQKMLTSSVERIAAIMDAEAVDASPILQVGEIIRSREAAVPPRK